jgi:hypothetical protein
MCGRHHKPSRTADPHNNSFLEDIMAQEPDTKSPPAQYGHRHNSFLEDIRACVPDNAIAPPQDNTLEAKVEEYMEQYARQFAPTLLSDEALDGIRAGVRKSILRCDHAHT